MKASIKFREDQNPLLRAKIPLNILCLPFQSGLVAGDSKDLSLHLSTFFQSGPSIKLSYRPNDSTNPFSLFLKTGTGPFGSPLSGSMLMTAEFSFMSRGNPKFMLHFKPQFGDFSIKKTQSSNSVFEKPKTTAFLEDSSIEVLENPFNKRVSILPSPREKHDARKAIAAALSGIELTAKTKLPVKSRAVMSFRWGVRVPAEIGSFGKDSTAAGIDFKKIPFLVMNKIGIEHVYEQDVPPKPKEVKNDDVAEECMKVKRQVEWLQVENLELKRAVDDLRREVGFGGKSQSGNDNGNGRYGDVEKYGRNYSNGPKMEKKASIGTDLNAEVNKSTKGANACVFAATAV